MYIIKADLQLWSGPLQMGRCHWTSETLRHLVKFVEIYCLFSQKGNGHLVEVKT